MPVLTPAIAREVRDRIPASVFLDAFERTSRRARNDRARNDDRARPLASDRPVLSHLLQCRNSSRRTTPCDIARAIGLDVRAVSLAIRRLDQCGLLPNRAAIDYSATGSARP